MRQLPHHLDLHHRFQSFLISLVSIQHNTSPQKEALNTAIIAVYQKPIPPINREKKNSRKIGSNKKFIIYEVLSLITTI